MNGKRCSDDAVTIAPIIPTARREAFDGPEWTFELKFDGFRAIADTVNGRMHSKRGNRRHRFEALLGSLPADCVLDGEVAALEASGRPVFADLMFGRRPPIFVAFDVLVDRGEDVRALPLARRKAVLKRLAIGARRWIALADGVPGQGRRPFELVAEMDLEVTVAMRVADAYAPGRTVWWKIPNRAYSQKDGRSELFEREQEVRFEQGVRCPLQIRRVDDDLASTGIAGACGRRCVTSRLRWSTSRRVSRAIEQRPRVALPVESVGARCNCFV